MNSIWPAVFASLILSACAGMGKKTLVTQSDPIKAAASSHVSVVFLNTGKVSFGNIVTAPAEASHKWQVSETVEKAAQKSLESAGKQMDSFRSVTVESGKLPEISPDPKSDTIIFISETAFTQQDFYYSGIGIVMDKRKRVFQTVIQPFAMLEVIVRFKGEAKPLRAFNSRYINGSTAANVEGVTFHNSLGEFPADQRAKLNTALQERIEVVVNALFSDLGFAKN